MLRGQCVAHGLQLLWLTCLLLLVLTDRCTIAAAQKGLHRGSAAATESALASAPVSSPTAEVAASELGGVDADSVLLRELDRLIELQERKVQLLTDMKRDQQQRRASDAAAAPPLDPPIVQPASSPAAAVSEPLPAAPARAGASPPPSPWHSFSVSHFVSRAALFLVAIACTVLYQHYSRRTGGERRRKAVLAEQEDIAALERQWRQRRLQSLRVLRDGQLRPRVHRGGGELGGGAVSAVVYGDEDELREEEEEGAGRVLDEAQGDYWDASSSRHEAYAGVLGTGEEAEEAEEAAEGQSMETQQAASASALVAADSEDDDDEVDDEDWQEDHEEEEEEEDGHG